jgi:hypothetical protein
VFRRCWPDAPSQKLVAAVSATDSGPTMAALHISLPEIFSRHRASPTQWLPNPRTAYSGQRRPTEPVLRRVPQAGRCRMNPAEVFSAGPPGRVDDGSEEPVRGGL